MIVREFKPCPRCGGTNIGIVIGPFLEWGRAVNRKYAYCHPVGQSGCGQTGPPGDTDDEVGIRWNEMADTYKGENK